MITITTSGRGAPMHQLTTNPITRPRQGGFTLTELMIVVVIVGILASIAYPSYRQYVVGANQSAAQEFMMDLASRAEQYKLDARQYPSGIGTNAGEIDVDVPNDVDNYYDVSLSQTANGYQIVADPRSGTTQAGEPTLTLNSSGAKTPADEWE